MSANDKKPKSVKMLSKSVKAALPLLAAAAGGNISARQNTSSLLRRSSQAAVIHVESHATLVENHDTATAGKPVNGSEDDTQKATESGRPSTRAQVFSSFSNNKHSLRTKKSRKTDAQQKDLALNFLRENGFLQQGEAKTADISGNKYARKISAHTLPFTNASNSTTNCPAAAYNTFSYYNVASVADDDINCILVDTSPTTVATGTTQAECQTLHSQCQGGGMAVAVPQK